MRDVEELGIEDTSKLLGLRPQIVKTRLHRARRLLRGSLQSRLSTVLSDVFPFAGSRCARICDAVIARIDKIRPKAGGARPRSEVLRSGST